MIAAGQRQHLVTFVRNAKITDNYGQEIDGVPENVAQAFARVRHGTGQERREAAQERFQQAATFECNRTPHLAAVLLTDKIQFDAADWDITSRAPVGLHEIHFAAVRAA